MTTPICTVDRAISDPQLLGAALGDLAPWQTWRTVLKAAFALGLMDEERRIFEEVSGGRLLFQLFNVLNARSDEQSAFNGVFENGWLWMAVILSLLLQVAVVYAPFLQEAFSTVSLSAGDWLVCGAEAARAEQDHHSGTPRRRSAWGQCRPMERPKC